MYDFKNIFVEEFNIFFKTEFQNPSRHFFLFWLKLILFI